MLGQRILVVGCSGSGKTTLSLKLGELTGLPVVHLDKLYHMPGWVPRPREEFDMLLTRELRKDTWIIDGNFERTLPLRLSYCDTVVYFDFPRRICIRGILTRVLKSYGKTRPDMGEGCPEHFDWAFIKFIWNFKKIQGAKNKEVVSKSGKPVIWLRSRREVRQFLEDVRHDTDN